MHWTTRRKLGRRAENRTWLDVDATPQACQFCGSCDDVRVGCIRGYAAYYCAACETVYRECKERGEDATDVAD